MATKTKKELPPEVIKHTHDGPEGFEVKTSDLAGFWDGELGLPIQGVPLDVNLSDSEIDTTKTSALIRFRLTATTTCLVDGQPKELEADSNVGVWWKPGMKDLVDCAGVEVFMYMRGEKEIGKPSPMKTYTVKTKNGKAGGKLSIIGDYRKESRANNTVFDPEIQVLSAPAPF